MTLRSTSSTGATADPERLQAAIDELREKLNAHQSAVAAGLDSLREEIELLDHRLGGAGEETETEEVPIEETQQESEFRLPGQPKPVAADPSEFDFSSGAGETPSAGDAIEEVLFGPDLAANESFFADRSELISGIFQGEEVALSFVGQIMIFRGATAERLPQLLKDIGEAYYAWRRSAAEGADPFRDELTGWLMRKCSEAGVANKIELVQVGDRYDSKRHNARQTGVEVARVGGWVVLRENGRVYTKAAVDLK